LAAAHLLSGRRRAACLATGFPIFWYGWLATAVVIGAIAAWMLPRRWARRLPFDLSWIVPIVMIVAALTYEKRWF
jgi:hypothetical protein